MRVVIVIIGRMLLSAIFIIAALNKILNWDATKQVMFHTISSWHSYSLSPWAHELLTLLSSRVELFLCSAAIAELLGGLLVFFGLGVRLGSLLLILFLIPATIMFHPFWAIQPPERDVQVVMFMKNLSILGGLCVVLASGAGFRKQPLSSI